MEKNLAAASLRSSGAINGCSGMPALLRHRCSREVSIDGVTYRCDFMVNYPVFGQVGDSEATLPRRDNLWTME
jgi:hypothetical protein